jgi:hypothetical protein
VAASASASPVRRERPAKENDGAPAPAATRASDSNITMYTKRAPRKKNGGGGGDDNHGALIQEGPVVDVVVAAASAVRRRNKGQRKHASWEGGWRTQHHRRTTDARRGSESDRLHWLESSEVRDLYHDVTS